MREDLEMAEGELTLGSLRIAGGTPAPGRTPGSRGKQKRSFLRPGSVGAAWARCVAQQGSGSLRGKDAGGKHAGRKETGAGAGHGGIARKDLPDSLEAVSAFLRQRKRHVPPARRPPSPGPPSWIPR